MLTKPEENIVRNVSLGVGGWYLLNAGFITRRTLIRIKTYEKLKKLAGIQPFSMKLGDGYYSYEWMPDYRLSCSGRGRYISKSKDSGKSQKSRLSILESQNTVFSMAALQGLQKLFGGYSNRTKFRDSFVEGSPKLSHLFYGKQQTLPMNIQEKPMIRMY